MIEKITYIKLYSNLYNTTIENLKNILEKEFDNVASLDFNNLNKEPSLKFRAVDNNILIAIVGVLGTSVGALINGLLKIAQQNKAKHIIIYGKTGRKIKIPADMEFNKIKKIVGLAQQIDIDKIEF